MLDRKQEINLLLQQFIDGLLLLLTFWASFAVRYYGKDWFGLGQADRDFPNFVWMIPVIIPVGPIALEMQGFYTSPYQKTVGKSLGQMARAALWLVVVLGLCVIFFQAAGAQPRRGAAFRRLGCGGAHGSRAVHRAHLQAQSEKRPLPGECDAPPGLPPDMKQFRDSLTQDQLLEMQIVREFNIETEETPELVEALHAHSITRVIFAGAHSHMNRLQEAITACETEGVEAWLEANFIKTAIARPSFDTMGSKPMLVFRATPAFSWRSSSRAPST